MTSDAFERKEKKRKEKKKEKNEKKRVSLEARKSLIEVAA